MENTNEYKKASRHILFVWLGFVFAVPNMGVALLLAKYYADLKFDFDYQLDLTSTEFWVLATSLVIAGFVAAKIAERHFLDPKVLAKSPDAASTPEDASLVERVRNRVVSSVSIQLSIFNMIAMLFLVYGLLHDKTDSIIVAIIYALSALVLLRPDSGNLIRETISEINRTGN